MVPPAVAEVLCILAGVIACFSGFLLSHNRPLWQHHGEVEHAMLLVDRNVPILMPDSFRVEVTIKKTGLTVIGSEDILLLGGSIGDKDCSGGALFLYWSDGALGFDQHTSSQHQSEHQ